MITVTMAEGTIEVTGHAQPQAEDASEIHKLICQSVTMLATTLKYSVENHFKKEEIYEHGHYKLTVYEPGNEIHKVILAEKIKMFFVGIGVLVNDYPEIVKIEGDYDVRVSNDAHIN